MSPVATPSVQGQAIAALTAEDQFLDETEMPDWFPRDLPDKADLRLYKTPVQYWEPEFPGMDLMPFAKLGHFSSLDDGRWVCNTPWEEAAVRGRLARLGDPDDLKVTDEQLRVIRGTPVKGGPENQWCHSPLCRFVSCSPLAARLHAELRGHSIQPIPRKGR